MGLVGRGCREESGLSKYRVGKGQVAEETSAGLRVGQGAGGGMGQCPPMRQG